MNQDAEINSYYSKIAIEIGSNWSSTMLDKQIREKEIENLIRLIEILRLEQNKSEIRLLDIGCGNGYVASRLHCEFPNLTIDGIDTNPEMVDSANSRLLPRQKFYNISASKITTIPLEADSYHLVYSTRCFINISEEKERYESIELSSRFVKPGGFIALMEGFEDGQQAYNNLRKDFGWQTIPPAWHNYYLDADQVETALSSNFIFYSESELASLGLDRHFLSNRYLAMRVLLPLFKNDPDYFNLNRNDPVGMALSNLLPKTKGYSPLQLVVAKKSKKLKY